MTDLIAIYLLMMVLAYYILEKGAPEHWYEYSYYEMFITLGGTLFWWVLAIISIAAIIEEWVHESPWAMTQPFLNRFGNKNESK